MTQTINIAETWFPLERAGRYTTIRPYYEPLKLGPYNWVAIDPDGEPVTLDCLYVYEVRHLYVSEFSEEESNTLCSQPVEKVLGVFHPTLKDMDQITIIRFFAIADLELNHNEQS